MNDYTNGSRATVKPEVSDKTSDIVIAGRALTKCYNKLTAVDAVNFQVARGEFVAFLGPNGAGKTTLMRMVFSAVEKTAGELTIFGMEPIRERKGINSHIGVVFQDNNLDEELNVVNNLRIYAKYCGLDERTARPRYDELLEMMSLTEKRHSKVRELSGGMMRRLMIARALLGQPRLLILDEPTTGLDPQVRHAIWAVLRQLKRKGLTVLMTTHYMEEAQTLADRVIIMDRGQIILDGEPLQLIRDHVEPFVLQVSDLHEPLSPAGEVRHERIGEEDYFFCQSEEPLRAISKELDPKHVVLRYANLEDVFFKFTGRGLKE